MFVGEQCVEPELIGAQMKKTFACVVSALLAVGCIGGGDRAARDPAPGTPHTAKPFGGGPDVFRFAIVADRTGQARPGVFEDAVEKLNLLQPDFVMSVGDLIEGHSYVLSDLQAAYAAEALARNAGVRWLFVFMHRPLWADAKFSEWQRIEPLLASRPHTVFAGHEHKYSMHERNGGTYLTLATTGAHSPLLGPETGTFDHVTWVTMTDGGPRIANLLLDGILDQRGKQTDGQAVEVAPVKVR